MPALQPMKAVLRFTALYAAVLFAYGVAVDSPLTYLYTGITALIIATFLVFHHWVRFPLSVWWGISLIGLVNMIGGVGLVDGEPVYIAGFVGPIPFDKFFHMAAAFVLAFVAWHVLKSFAGEGYHRGGMLVMAFLVVMGGGAVVEIAELIGSALSDVSVGDYGNNALDLVANAIGALAGLIIIGVRKFDRSEMSGFHDRRLFR